MRITLLAGAILLLCSLILTMTASYNARTQFINIELANPQQAKEPYRAIEESRLPTVGIAPNTTLSPAVTQAKDNFDTTIIIILVIVSVLGMGLVYIVAGRSLDPIHELSKAISTITEHELKKRIPHVGRKDEVGVLAHSFNIMLDRLEKSFLKQKRFSANVAHELKTPLAIIHAGTQVLHMEKNPSKSEYEETLAITEKNVKRLMAVVDDLMNLYDEKEGFETTSICLKDMFETICSELHPHFEEKQIVTELHCELHNVKGYEALLYRAFFNLIENAAKYNKIGGKIHIKAMEINGVGQISISDTGNGIYSDELLQIFEPFYRVNKSRSRKTGGVGLGLSIVKTIIEKHGWKITVDSTFGQGSVFTISGIEGQINSKRSSII